MTFSCCLWALSGPDEITLPQVAELGFKAIDIQPEMLTSAAAAGQARQLALQVCCIGASFGLPDGVGLDSAGPGLVEQALAHLDQAFAHGASLGATTAYVVPGFDSSAAALARFAGGLSRAAEAAARHGLKLAVEHFPGRALPTAATTLDFLARLDHPNLYLLFDIGHIMLAGEDPVAVIKAAGPRLGYVHLDDNDGQGDLHWALLDGVLTKTILADTFQALADAGYAGPISLELNPALPNPRQALRQSRQIVLELREHLA
jgi:hydroxypyruvate isomerase